MREANRSELWCKFFEAMLIARPLVGALLAFIILLALASFAPAAECLRSTPQVHARFSFEKVFPYL